eukprot:1157563-Pelagomonas_calceolata.AAC.12
MAFKSLLRLLLLGQQRLVTYSACTTHSAGIPRSSRSSVTPARARTILGAACLVAGVACLLRLCGRQHDACSSSSTATSALL